MNADYKQHYVDYLHLLKSSIFKILPLYEKNDENLEKYLTSLSFMVHNVKKVISDFVGDDTSWLIQTLGIVEGLKEECKKRDNHAFVRSTILGTLNNLDKKIQTLES